MNLLFSLPHPGYLRNFDSTIRLLATRGHTIRLLFSHRKKAKREGSALLNEYGVQYRIQTDVRSFPSAFWTPWGSWIRSVHDYVRYFRPEFRHAAKLRSRAAVRVPMLARGVAALPPFQRIVSGSLFTRMYHQLESAIPPDAAVLEYLRAVHPDVLIVSPLVDFGSPQTELLKAARALGIRTALLVHSWDNLTNKGQIHVLPDLVAVWNRLQEGEAIRIHGVPAPQIVVTGAEAYDHWFTSTPSDRREFCNRIGLEASRPYFLYVGSSTFISSDESTFAREWISRLRSAPDLTLRSAGVLIRPHPQNVHCWRSFHEEHRENVAVYPRDGANPMNIADRQDLCDSIYHASAVVGVNTSALIDAAILGREVLTLLDDRFQETQEGTIHFHYLVDPEFGFLRAARSLDEHVKHLADTLRLDHDAGRRARRFVETFVRPHGLDVSATPRVVQAIEDLYTRPALRPVAQHVVPRYLSLLPALIAMTIEPRRKWSTKDLKRHQPAQAPKPAAHRS